MTTNLGYSNGVAFFYVFHKQLTFKYKKSTQALSF